MIAAVLVLLFPFSVPVLGFGYPRREKATSPRMDDIWYRGYNLTRATLSGIAAYRSALTLDWLAAEDTRQRELVAAFEQDPHLPQKIMDSDCMAYPRPSTGKVARLMLELLRNLEGDEGMLIPYLIQGLVKAKLLVLETSIFDVEPDLDSLVETPAALIAEPHVNFPRVLAMVWFTVTDPSTRKFGWCAINKVSQYLSISRGSDIAKTMRALDPVLARARFIMEEFIQQVTPMNMMDTELERQKITTRRRDMQEYAKPRSNAARPNRNQVEKETTTYPRQTYDLTHYLTHDLTHDRPHPPGRELPPRLRAQQAIPNIMDKMRGTEHQMDVITPTQDTNPSINDDYSLNLLSAGEYIAKSRKFLLPCCLVIMAF